MAQVRLYRHEHLPQRVERLCRQRPTERTRIHPQRPQQGRGEKKENRIMSRTNVTNVMTSSSRSRLRHVGARRQRPCRAILKELKILKKTYNEIAQI